MAQTIDFEKLSIYNKCATDEKHGFAFPKNRWHFSCPVEECNPSGKK